MPQQGPVTAKAAGGWLQDIRPKARRLGRYLWTGKEEMPKPKVWTAEEIAAAWDAGEIPPPEFPDTWFGRFDRRVTQFTKFMSYLAGIGLLTIVLVLVVDVIGWKFFGRPVPSQADWVQNMNVVAVFFAACFVQMDRGSTAIELFQKRFNRYVKVGVRAFAAFLGLASCSYCAYRGVVLTHEYLVEIKRATGEWKFIIWPFTACMSIGFILLSFGFLVTGLRDILEFSDKRARYAVRKPKPTAGVGTPEGVAAPAPADDLVPQVIQLDQKDTKLP
jgi:TRAP-type C4-dicarboxylate transport system permease small subunit